MTKDDRILDLKIFVGRKKDRTEDIQKISDFVGMVGGATSVAGGFVEAVMLTCLTANKPVPPEYMWCIGGVAAGGLVIHLLSKFLNKKLNKRITKLDGLYQHLNEMDNELIEYNKLRELVRENEKTECQM